MTRDPHYLRVARALALITGLAGVATGCGGDDVSGTDGSVSMDGTVASDGGGDGTDGGGGGTDGGGTDGGEGVDGGEMADAGGTDGGASNDGGAEDGGTAIADGGDICATCVCFATPGVDAGLPMCDGDEIITCGCAAIGPLFPPDLPV
jgi:hypothetical protein